LPLAIRLFLRKAKLSDSEKISDLLTQLGYSVKKEFIAEKLLEFRDDNDEKLVVAAANKIVVGFISIHFIPQIALPGQFARISYFCVDEAHRNKNIGNQLESYCEKIARKRGCDRIELHCHKRRTQAHRFYKAQGYEESPKYFVKML
jgi:GNAT superfamily N-acetyltransferase